MAWPQAPKAKDIIGMEADELKAKLDGAATKEDLKAITDANTATTGTLNEIKAALAALKPAEPATVVAPADTADDAAVRMLSDPTGFVDSRLKDVSAQSLDTRAALEEMRARTKFSSAFNLYGEELMKSAATFKPEQRANANFWDWHIRTVLGDKVIRGEIRAGSFPNLLGPSSGAPGSAEDKDANQGFNPEMAAFFKTRGLPLEKAAKIRDLMVRDGETIRHDNYFGKPAN
jgi:hypothetical protein